MLGEHVAIGNIDHAEAFVEATIQRVQRQYSIWFSPQEREELMCDGLLILVELHARYEPRRNGHTKDGEFSGFARTYLPKKLADAWHKRHENHVVRVRKGRRFREYLPEADDIADYADDELHAGGLDDPLIELGMAATPIPIPSLTSRFARNIAAAVRGQLNDEHALTVQVAVLKGLDLHRSQICEALGCTEIEVQMALLRLRKAGEVFSANGDEPADEAA